MDKNSIYSPFHDICYISFALKFEGMNCVVVNFKRLRIIGGTNIIITNTNNMLACPKKCLNIYRNTLQLTIEDSLGLSLSMVSQVHN